MRAPTTTTTTRGPERAGPTSLWSLTHGQRLRYGAAVAAMAVGILLLFVVPQITRGVIDGFTKDAASGAVRFSAPPWLADLAAPLGLAGSTVALLLAAGLASLVLSTIGSGFQYLRGRWAAIASEAILRRLRDHLNRHLAGLPASYFDRADTGDLVQRCTSDVETVRVFLAAQVVEIGRSILLVLCVTPILLSIDVPMTAWTLCLVPIIVLYSFVFFGRLTRVFKAADEAEGAMTTVLQENLTGIRVVRSFGRAPFEEAKFDRANVEHRDATWRLMRLLSAFWSFSDLVCMSQGALVLFVGASRVLAGTLTVGTLVAFTLYSGMVIWPVRMLGRTLVDAGKARVSLGRLREILAEPLEDEDDAERDAWDEDALGREVAGRITAEGLVFSYGADAASPVVLDGLDVELPAGGTLALVGPPGSGKSAFVHALLRLYDRRGGRLEVDGKDVRAYDRRHLRAQIGVVFQDPFLYARTIERNLHVARPPGAVEATRDELEAAARAASIHESIEAFEEGYDTLLGERGVTLSGGQKQRLAIARALLKDPPILVLDDALSAVDVGTERRILEALRQRQGRHTTILVAHRLSVVRGADEILVLDRGRVTERGTHAELLAAGGSYARLWRIQNALEGELGAHAAPAQDPAGTLATSGPATPRGGSAASALSDDEGGPA